jgi:hypothetical protein
MSLEKHFLDSHLTLASSVTSMGTFSPGYCRQGAAVPGASGAQVCLRTTAGPSKEIFHRQNTAENLQKSPFRKEQKQCCCVEVHIFIAAYLCHVKTLNGRGKLRIPLNSA